MTSPGSRRLRTALLLAWPLGLLAFCYRGVLTGQVLAGRDLFRLAIPDAAFLRDCLLGGELPLWNPYLRLGQPFLAALQTQALYPPRVLCTLLFGPVWGVTVEQLLHAGLGAWGTWLAARALRRTRVASVVAALIFSACLQLSLLANEPNMAGAVAWTGWLVFLTLRAVRRPTLELSAWLALVLALDFAAGSPETLCWQLLACAAAALTVRRPSRGSVPLLLGASAWALALSAVTLLPALELLQLSARASGVHAPLSWSTAPSQLLAVVWPMADRPRGAYWDDEWLVTPFVGVLPALLACCAFRNPRRTGPWVVLLGVLGAVSLGAHLGVVGWLLSHPPFDRFRYPAKALPGVAFCLAILAASGADALPRGLLPRWKHRLGAPRAAAVLLALALGATALLTLATRVLPLRAGARDGVPWIGSALVLLSVVAARAAGGRLRGWVLACVGLELLAGQALLGAQPFVPARSLSTPSALARALPTGFEGRISADLSLGTNAEHATNAQVLRFLAGARDALVPQTYVQDRVRAIEGLTTPELGRIDAFLATGGDAARLASVAFAVRGAPPSTSAQKVATLSPETSLYALPRAMPRGWLVHETRSGTDPEVLAWLGDGARDADQLAYLEPGLPLLDGESCLDADRAKHLRDSSLHQRWELDACTPAVLVMNDAYAPGWEATVDGAAIAVLRVDHALRGVAVPAGHHVVALDYRPGSFLLGARLSLLALGLVAVAFALSSRGRRRARRQADG